MSENVKVAQNFDVKPRTKDVLATENVNFSGFLLAENLLKGLKDAGFEKASPIQVKAIPLGTCGLDLIVQAKSGTGKTCVFTVVALNDLVINSSSTQVLVLAPTREIAVQIWEVVNVIGAHIEGLRCYTFIGGLPVTEDKEKLKKCHIAVGTPGRVKQLIEEGALTTESVRLFVLDEADKLMEGGFQEVINWIYSALPVNKQMLALSATYPESLAQHLTAYMRNPTFIRLNSEDPALMGIRQYSKKVAFHPLVQKAFEFKVTELINILSSVAFNQCLVFSNYQARAESLSNTLNAKGWPATHISGAQDQLDRLTAMATLKKYKCRVLVSTDLTSRGIDAEHINLVINLDIPKDHDTYLHRIGRAGRFGSFGAGITLASEGKEMAQLKKIEEKCKTSIKSLPDPIPSNLAHSSGYVDIDKLVTTETVQNSTEGIQTMRESSNKCDGTDLQTLRPESEGVSEQTNNKQVADKGLEQSTERAKSDGNKPKDDTTDNQKNVEPSETRKILKSKRQGMHKTHWGDWLSTSEDSIHLQNDRRECVRDTVTYEDVDIFSNAKPKKHRHKKIQNTMDTAKGESGISQTNTHTGVNQRDVDENKEKIGDTEHRHNSPHSHCAEETAKAASNINGSGEKHSNNMSSTHTFTNKHASSDSMKSSKERKTGKSGHDKLKDMSYEQLLASYMHQQNKKKDNVESNSDEEIPTGQDKTVENNRTPCIDDGHTKDHVDKVEEFEKTETNDKGTFYSENNKLDELEFEQLRCEVKAVLYGNRYPEPTAAKCYKDMYDEYVADLDRFKNLAPDKQEEELQRVHTESQVTKKEKGEEPDYQQLCGKIDKILKHMRAIQCETLETISDDSKVNQLSRAVEIKVQTKTLDTTASADKKGTLTDTRTGGSSQNIKEIINNTKEHKVKEEQENVLKSSAGVKGSYINKEEAVKPKKPMFLAMKPSKVEPLHSETKFSSNKSGVGEPLHLKTKYSDTLNQGISDSMISDDISPKTASNQSQDLDSSSVSSSNQKVGNVKVALPSGSETLQNTSNFSLGVEYIKKLGALHDNMRGNNKQESPEEGEISESDDNNDTRGNAMPSKKKTEAKGKCVHPYGPWVPVEATEEKLAEGRVEYHNQDDGYYGDSYYSEAYGRNEGCDWYQEPIEEYVQQDYEDCRDDRVELDRRDRIEEHYSQQQRYRGYYGEENIHRKPERSQYFQGSYSDERDQDYENYTHRNDRYEQKRNGSHYGQYDYDGQYENGHGSSYKRSHHSANSYFGDRSEYYPQSSMRRYPPYLPPWNLYPSDYQSAYFQFEQAQSAMWASHVNHAYWMGQRCHPQSASAQQYKQLSEIHSKWADYYRGLYKQSVKRDKTQHET